MKIDEYQKTLASFDNYCVLVAYLLSNSGLPGPRGNLELASAAADLLDEETLLSFIRDYPPETAPVNHPGEFVAFCGTRGLGRLVTEGKSEYLDLIRKQTDDPRWRLREASAMALQKIGSWNMEYLLEATQPWINGGWLVKRAVAAGLAEPALLKDNTQIIQVLDIFDRLTSAVESAGDLKQEDFLVLRQALGYAWSVVVCAYPAEGKCKMERWMNSTNRNIHWIIKENMKKKRMERMDLEWVMLWRKQNNGG